MTSPLDTPSTAAEIGAVAGRLDVAVDVIVEVVSLGEAVLIDDITEATIEESISVDRTAGRRLPAAASLISTAGGGTSAYWARARIRLGQRLTSPSAGLSVVAALGVYSASKLFINRETDPATTRVELLDCLKDLDKQITEPYVGIGLVQDTINDQASAARMAVGFDLGPRRWSYAQAWPRGTTRLDIVIDTLHAHGWRTPWTHPATGALLSKPLNEFGAVVGEISHEGPNSVLSPTRNEDEVDLDAPNEWLIVPADGIENVQPERRVDEDRGAASQNALSGRATPHVVDVDAADQAALAALADRWRDLGIGQAHLYPVETSPYPVAWHDERVSYADERTAEVLCEVCAFEMPLDGSADTKWTLGPIR